MRKHLCTLSLLWAISVVLGLTPATAAEPVKIVSGGPAGVKALDQVKAEMEKAAGTKLDVSMYKIDVSCANLNKGVIDATILPLEPEVFNANSGKFNCEKFDLNKYSWTVLSEGSVHLALNPENKETLDKQKITDILNGKMKTWSNGKPLTVFAAKTLNQTNISVCKTYTGSETCKAAQMVTDQDGLLNAIKANADGVAIISAKFETKGFSPRMVATDAKMKLYLIWQKTARAEVQKAFEALKAKGAVSTD